MNSKIIIIWWGIHLPIFRHDTTSQCSWNGGGWGEKMIKRTDKNVNDFRKHENYSEIILHRIQYKWCQIKYHKLCAAKLIVMLWWFIVCERLLHLNVSFCALLKSRNIQSSMSQCNDIVDNSSTSSICKRWRCLMFDCRTRTPHTPQFSNLFIQFPVVCFQFVPKESSQMFTISKIQISISVEINANHCFGNIQLQSNHTRH